MESLVTTNQDNGIVQFSPEQVLSQVQTIQALMKQVMIKDQHYGTIPGTPKPTLYKAGAEKLNFTFRLAPKFKIEKSDLKDGHREYEIICELFHINSGLFFGAGVGSCSTMETKYRYRESKRKCPACQAEAIIKGKQEYGGGWVCFKKQNGCGAKFADNDSKIVDQKIGRIENPDLADQYNTVLKMAKKRSLVDSTITACAASDIFSQDLEDLDVKVENGKKPGTPPKATNTKETTKQSNAEFAEELDNTPPPNGTKIAKDAPTDSDAPLQTEGQRKMYVADLLRAQVGNNPDKQMGWLEENCKSLFDEPNVRSWTDVQVSWLDKLEAEISELAKP